MRWKVILDKEYLDNDDLRYITMHCLYGVFCDTCTLNFLENFKTFQAVRKWCFGCEDHANKGFMYGPMTILEHMILTIKKASYYLEMKNLQDKLIELGIVKRSFFAPIQL